MNTFGIVTFIILLNIGIGAILENSERSAMQLVEKEISLQNKYADNAHDTQGDTSSTQGDLASDKRAGDENKMSFNIWSFFKYASGLKSFMANTQEEELAIWANRMLGLIMMFLNAYTVIQIFILIKNKGTT